MVDDPHRHPHRPSGGPVERPVGRPPGGTFDTRATGCAAMGRFGWYRRFHAWVLHSYAARYNAHVDARKRRLIGSLAGDVLEIGAGSGANLPYYDAGVRLTAVEPNAAAHPYLRDGAAARGIPLTILAGTAEALPVPDRSQDAVVGTLVLCTVRDPARALAEVRRVLRPGGCYVYLEHVAAERGSARRRRQRMIRPIWRWLADGCEPDRETASRIAAAGFRKVEMERFLLPYPIVGPHIAGRAFA